jgi:hypothetical protein
MTRLFNQPIAAAAKGYIKNSDGTARTEIYEIARSRSRGFDGVAAAIQPF